MKIEIIAVGPLQANCILIGNDSSTQLQGVIIDPGSDSALILERVAEIGLQVDAILLTHGHVDHLGVASTISEKVDAPVLVHPDDLPIYHSGETHAALLGLPYEPPPVPSAILDHGKELRYGKDLVIKVIHTPGHSPGSVCFLVTQAKEQVLVAGDTLFRRGVGRTDLPGGSRNALSHSIRDRLYSLPDELRVICGHGPDTTIGEEKTDNPWIHL